MENSRKESPQVVIQPSQISEGRVSNADFRTSRLIYPLNLSGPFEELEANISTNDIFLMLSDLE